MHNRKQTIVFIINPISGTVRKLGIPDVIASEIDSERYDWKILHTQYAGHAAQLATEAAVSGTDIVVAVGGDGTVNEVARAIRDTRTALGIIPCGSGNGLARHLMLPLNVRKAIRIINECVIHDLDYGIIDGNPFFCTCGMGFDAFISKKFAEAGKRGVLTYLEKMFTDGLRYKPSHYTIEDESGNIIERKAYLISCANASQYGNNAYIAPQASMRDGLLDVIIMEPVSVLNAGQMLIEMINKTIDRNAKVTTYRTRRLIVHRDEPDVIHFDGDPVMAGKDIEIHLVEKGIRVIVNGNADKSQRRPNLMQNSMSEIIDSINKVNKEVATGLQEVATGLQKVGSEVMQVNKLLQRLIDKL